VDDTISIDIDVTEADRFRKDLGRELALEQHETSATITGTGSSSDHGGHRPLEAEQRGWS
jgi:hypothetical protein